jgi:hypothetical protein
LALSLGAGIAEEDDNVSLKASNTSIKLSKEQASNQYDVTGLWKMVGRFVAFQYALELQQNENIIIGNITRTNGQEPIDTISGFVYPDGKIVFNRTRPGVRPEVYTGIVSGSGDSLAMQGNYTSGGVFKYPWNATLIEKDVDLSSNNSGQEAIGAAATGGLSADANTKPKSSGSGGHGHGAGVKRTPKASSKLNE